MKIEEDKASAIVRTEARLADAGVVDKTWESKIEIFSELCAGGLSKTHIAFLGTLLIAKATSAKVDLYAIKPNHAGDNPNAFSARILSENVLVPLAAELGINIGVSGRQPLNNQPYFRMTRLGDGTPVHSGGRAAFDYMLQLVEELDAIADEATAREALRAFIKVRRKYQPRYVPSSGAISASPERLVQVIEDFVGENSEGGRRAQAVVAGLMDVFAGSGRVESGRINDPSRKYPGDVCIRQQENDELWEKAFEVRDKPVRSTDVHIFGKKCVEMGVREAAVVMVSATQETLDITSLRAWAAGYGLGLTIFHGWNGFVDQVLFWSQQPRVEAALLAVETIEERLIAVEAAPRSVARWNEMTRPAA